MSPSQILARCLNLDAHNLPIPDTFLDELDSHVDRLLDKAQRAVVNAAQVSLAHLTMKTADFIPDSPPLLQKLRFMKIEQVDDVPYDTIQKALEPSEIRETVMSPQFLSEDPESKPPVQQDAQEMEQVIYQVARATLKEPEPINNTNLTSRCFCCREYWDPAYKKPPAKEDDIPYVSITNIPIYVFPPKPYPQPPKPVVADEAIPYVSLTNIPIYVWPK